MLCPECGSTTFRMVGRDICPTCLIAVDAQPEADLKFCETCQAFTIQVFEDRRWFCTECSVEVQDDAQED
jgi:hypothetical protein